MCILGGKGFGQKKKLQEANLDEVNKVSTFFFSALSFNLMDDILLLSLLKSAEYIYIKRRNKK